MNYQNELVKWNLLYENHKKFKSELKKISKLSENENFYNDLKVIGNNICGEYGPGYNCVNGITIKKIVDIFYLINKDEDQNNNSFLLGSDGTKECTEIIKWLIDYNNKNIKFVTFNKFKGFDKKFVSSTIKKIGATSTIYLSKSIFNQKEIVINLYDKNGIKVNSNILNGIIGQIDKNLDDIVLSTNRDNIAFLNNESLIKLFVEKIVQLFPKNHSSKKTKITISNRSNEITKILTKLIGSQDFSYVVNQNTKNKPIKLLEKHKYDDYKVKKYFWSEILYAKRKKSNFLIIFSPDGSQLFLFVFLNRKVIYLNPNLMSLIFLHNFYTNLALENKKLSNMFISSNDNLSLNVLNLARKYKINFQKNQNNYFNNFQEYMLLYWNDYGQFIFGEKINDEFTIYHLLIKILVIIDYYNNQYSSVSGLLNKLEKIYGEFEIQEKFIFDIDENTINRKIETFINDKKNEKFILKSQKHDFADIDWIEKDLWTIELHNNDNLQVKYNKLANKTFLTLRKMKNRHILKDLFKNTFDNKIIIQKIINTKI